MRFTRAVVAVVALGCGRPYGDESEFERAFAGRWCDRQMECALGDFERSWSSMEDCIDDKEDHVDVPGWDNGCDDIDPEGADDCLDYLESTSCAGFEKHEIEDACDDAYDC